MDMKDLYWAAGFLEGEGAFQMGGRTGRYPVVAASQVVPEPLEYLQRIFGGKIARYKRSKNNPRHNDYYRWYPSGMVSRGVMMTLYPLMSPKRQSQIRECLLKWQEPLRRNWNADKTLCKHGHLLEGDNLYIYSDGRRSCRQCSNERSREYQARLRSIRPLAAPRQRLTHCKRGHIQDDMNVYTNPNNGRRYCRPCHTILALEWSNSRREQRHIL